jgi:hypothetical protein
VSVFCIIDHHCLCLIFTVDVESDISRVVHVVDAPDMNENATQAGFFNASQAGPCNVENVNCDHEPVVMESLPLNSETFEHLKKPVLRSLAIAHGILMSEHHPRRHQTRVSEMAICHQMIYVRVSLVM